MYNVMKFREACGLLKYLNKILFLQEHIDARFSLVSEKYRVLLELAFFPPSIQYVCGEEEKGFIMPILQTRNHIEFPSNKKGSSSDTQE